MNMNERRLHTWRRSALGGIALLIVLMIGTALAATPTTTAYHFSSHPMISGTVVAVNDHQMVVNTDQGQQVTLEMDTRTMAPRDLAPGMVMRADFLALEDCRFYAQRVMPIRAGMSTRRTQAYANTRDHRDAMVGNTSTFNGDRRARSSGQVAEGPGSVQEMELDSPGAITTATPTTADYAFSTRPMISGRVLLVNDHWLVIETDQGRRVGLVMDSNTMVPGDVAIGSALRTEFTQLKDGRYYAKRVSQVGSDVADREQAYAHTRDSQLAIASSPSDCGFSNSDGVTSTMELRGTGTTPDPVVEPGAATPVVKRLAVLPQTASHQPLILLLGLFALGSAGLVTVVRGLMTA